MKTHPQFPGPIFLPPLGDRPLVSVLTPCFNAGRYIEETIECVLAQSYANWEMVICDDGSTDDAVATINSLMAQDSRVRLVCQANAGAASATNSAFRCCKGEIIVFLDADDLSAPRRIEAIVEAFQRNPESGFATHRLRGISSVGERLDVVLPGHDHLVSGWFAPKMFEMRKHGCSAPSSGIAVRHQVLDTIMPIPERCKRTQDAFIIGTSLLLTSAIGIDEELGYYRIHPGGQTSGKRFHEAYHNGKIVDQINLGISIGEFVDSKGDTELREWSDSGMITNSPELMMQIACYWLCTGLLHEKSPHELGGVIERLSTLRWPFELMKISPTFIRNAVCHLLRLRDQSRKQDASKDRPRA